MEYQINVSLNGRFLFRTDWDDDKERAFGNAHTLRVSMPLCEVTLMSRGKTMREVQF